MVTAMLIPGRDQSVEKGWPNHSPMATCCYSAPGVVPEASMKKKSLKIILI